ncbi:hypothetical protein VNO78_08471 [Psophocarpus tetragonolobus]|uniref:Uncharacterized protein n=1 Tax=Psophocarpus tetragonolobus TaxID=3891 RepID=A0AAN9XSN1_PSOTE
MLGTAFTQQETTSNSMLHSVHVFGFPSQAKGCVSISETNRTYLRKTKKKYDSLCQQAYRTAKEKGYENSMDVEEDEDLYENRWGIGCSCLGKAVNKSPPVSTAGPGAQGGDVSSMVDITERGTQAHTQDKGIRSNVEGGNQHKASVIISRTDRSLAHTACSKPLPNEHDPNRGMTIALWEAMKRVDAAPIA